MSYAAIAKGIGGTASAYGGVLATQAKARGLDSASYIKLSDALQMRRQANQEMAVAQRSAEEERLQGDLVASRALAVAAASGAGASDPTVMNEMAKIEGEKALRSAIQIYGGEEAKRGLEGQARMAEFEAGQLAEGASSLRKTQWVGALSSIMGSGASAWQSYQGGK